MSLNELRKSIEQLKTSIKDFLGVAKNFASAPSDASFRFARMPSDVKRFVMLFVSMFAPTDCKIDVYDEGKDIYIDFVEDGASSRIGFSYTVDTEAETVSLSGCYVSTCRSSGECGAVDCYLAIEEIVYGIKTPYTDHRACAMRTLWRAALWCFSKVKIKDPLFLGPLKLVFDDGSELILNPDIRRYEEFFPFIVVPPKSIRKRVEWSQLIFCKASVAQLLLHPWFQWSGYNRIINIVKQVKKAAKNPDAWRISFP